MHGKSLSVAMPQQSTARIFNDAGERSQLLQQQNSLVKICLGAPGTAAVNFLIETPDNFPDNFPIYWKGGPIAHAERWPEVKFY